jgi:hypothetical protein
MDRERLERPPVVPGCGSSADPFLTVISTHLSPGLLTNGSYQSSMNQTVLKIKTIEDRNARKFAMGCLTCGLLRSCPNLNFFLRLRIKQFSAHLESAQGFLRNRTHSQFLMQGHPVLGNPSKTAVSAEPEPSTSAPGATNELQLVTDAELALLLQLEEAGAGLLSQLQVKRLALGFSAPPRCEADFQLAAQLRLQAVGAGDVSLETIASLFANDDDTEAARRVQDAQTNVAYDHLYAEAVARSMSMVRDPERDQDMGRRDELITSTRTLPCPICLEQLAFSATVVLGACEHRFCFTCATTYLDGIGRQRTNFPVPCPKCREGLNSSQCLAVLAGTGEPYSNFEKFITAKMYMSCERYCPNAKCGQVFDWFDDPALVDSPLRYQLMCWVCTNAFCAECKVPWHHGQSCEAYRAERDGETGLAELALAKQWKACPKCGVLIEKQTGDCNYVRCRCGQGFCHACGESYRTSLETANNTHGDPGCTCGIWPYVVDDIVEGVVHENQAELNEMPRDMLLGEIPPLRIVDAPAEHANNAGQANIDQLAAQPQFQAAAVLLNVVDIPAADDGNARMVDVNLFGVEFAPPHIIDAARDQGNNAHFAEEEIGVIAPRDEGRNARLPHAENVVNAPLDWGNKARLAADEENDTDAPPDKGRNVHLADEENEIVRNDLREIGFDRELEDDDNVSLGDSEPLVGRDDIPQDEAEAASVVISVVPEDGTKLHGCENSGPKAPREIDIAKLVRGPHPQRRHLSKLMLRALREKRCPVPGCRKTFASARSFAQHIEFTELHPTFACCGRPFISEQSFLQHRRSAACGRR